MQKFTNEVINENFTTEKKAAAFDSIAELYYNHNFGTATKGEIDLLMFKIYMEAAIENHINPDNSIDYSACSDYKIGVSLGISPAKVRNLKLKKELMYPQDNFDWRISLNHILSVPDNIKVDGNLIKINIPDPNLFNAVQDSIEDMGGYIDIQLNRKILCVRKEYLLELVYVAAQDEDIKTIENVINDALKEAENNGLPANSDLLQKIKIISSIGADIASIITSIADLCSPSSILTKTLKTLLGFIK